MPGNFRDLIKDNSILLSLEPEELGALLIKYLNGLQSNSYELNLINFISQNATGQSDQVKQALIESWSWLVRENLLAPKPGMESWFFITRRGNHLVLTDKIDEYRKEGILPRKRLHQKIADKAWSLFVRGDFDTAVFQSFKELEIAVRNAANLPATDVGVDLMRKAFRPDSGVLCDKSSPTGEQEALMHLMAGAIGSYKNPHSHRDVQIDGPEAAEMIMLASHLLKIVDKRHAI